MIRILTLALALLAAPALAQPQALAPAYYVEGINADGSHYKGELKVEPLSATTWAFYWDVEGQEFVGFGMLAHGTLSVAYHSDEKLGVVVYRGGPGGVYEGVWAVQGDEGVGRERLIPKH